jgi:predicted SAM-dependent methyltransferase
MLRAKLAIRSGLGRLRTRLGASLVRRETDPNVRFSDGTTPLILAASRNDLKAVEALLRKGADPNVPSEEGWYAYHFAKNSRFDDVAQRLLRAHGGVEPTFDYAAAYLKKAAPQQMEIYKALFSEQALGSKAFFNIGSGRWRHPYWTNVDYVSEYYNYAKSLIDIQWDISLLKPLDTPANSIELAYCSHTAEHLTDEQDRFMFREVHRILKPGAVFRVTCPNIDLYYQAYKRRDAYVRQHFSVAEPLDEVETMGLWFVNEIASQLVQDFDEHVAPMRDLREIEQILASLPMSEVCDYFCSRINYEVHRRNPGHHINWWTNDKMCRELKAAGFSETIVSLAGASVTPAMRDRNFFDTVNPTFSIFVDAIK